MRCGGVGLLLLLLVLLMLLFAVAIVVVGGSIPQILLARTSKDRATQLRTDRSSTDHSYSSIIYIFQGQGILPIMSDSAKVAGRRPTHFASSTRMSFLGWDLYQADPAQPASEKLLQTIYRLSPVRDANKIDV